MTDLNMTRDKKEADGSLGRGGGCRRALLIGTAQSVQQLHRSLGFADQRLEVVGCLVTAAAGSEISDGPVEGGGAAVLGTVNDLAAVATQHQVNTVLVSIPRALRAQTRKVIQTLDRLGLDWRFMPTLADQLAGRVAVAGVPSGGGDGDIDVANLINRQPRPLDEAAIRRTLAGRCVLITGAGGSIGTELARLTGRFGPSKLVLVERSENALFEIDREIARLHPNMPRAAVLHDVADAPRTMSVVCEHQPDIIFHAAAHKHVPMMEDHPAQAVENNFYGTRSVADAADRAGTGRFVMISTDKAVNPSSIMGATKRLAELYITDLNARSRCAFSMVRFGNVLGSACSVLPIWSRQLARGGPITVTHPDMHRYFMTIPEAAGLVIQSASFNDTVSAGIPGGGRVFLLDMGQPVRILDLAKRFIASHGLEPQTDVAIEFTGPRPGEKLFEELAYDGEGMLPTPHESIHIWQGSPADSLRIGQVTGAFDRLRSKGDGHPWQHATRKAILAALRTAVPEMVQAVAG